MCFEGNQTMNVLVVVAHHDDVELGCGATVARLVDEGHRVAAFVMTHSGFAAPDGAVCRKAEVARQEADCASRILGYELIAGDGETMDLPVTDASICRVLSVIRERRIDTILTHWHGDTHPPHQSVHCMALHASRTVPRVLGFAVNWHLGAQPFQPTFFVGVTEQQFERKMEAFRCFESEHKRSGTAYFQYHDALTRAFGLQMGTARAEGFVTYKYLYPG